ncbi:MAG: hypothetical protein M3Y42_19135, partial [Actinomycetota bacterium]|nr:hypothetical protein [Actinomycetota bacterium]
SGNSVEVQDPATGQITVNFTASTAFSQTKAVTRAALTAGECVTAIGQRSTASGAASSPVPSPSETSRPSLPTSFTAMSVAISPAVNGACTTAGFGGGRTGARPSGSGRPTDRPSGSGGGFGGGGFTGGGFGGLASGKVSQLTGDTMLVQITGRGNQASTTDTVTLGTGTTYTETASATSAAMKVGQCVSATGKADSTGAVAATRIALSTAGPNGCSTGFGRRPQASSTGA